jgi:hypothetical protein
MKEKAIEQMWVYAVIISVLMSVHILCSSLVKGWKIQVEVTQKNAIENKAGSPSK